MGGALCGWWCVWFGLGRGVVVNPAEPGNLLYLGGIMIRVFNKLQASKLFQSQRSQYSETLILSGVVPANAGILTRTAVSNLGHFLCLRVTGSFSTLRTDAVVGLVDDGIDHLRGQLIDGAGQRKLFNDFVPLSLWLSPGRRRDLTALNAYQAAGAVPAAPAGGSLFYPVELEYLFTANSEILLDMRNDSNAANRFDVAFHGIRILSGVSVAGVRGV